MTKMESQAFDAAGNVLEEQRHKLLRKRLMLGLAGSVLVIGSGYAAYSHFYGSQFVSTDNAYTAAETAQVTPAISGIVRDVRVTDTQRVRRGDVLVVLDDTDARLALAQADAELGRALRRVRGYVANDRNLTGLLESRGNDRVRMAAQVQAAQADFERARIDLDRREALAESGSVSGDELTRARNAFASASASVTAAKAAAAQSHANYEAAIGAREANAVLIVDSTEDTNPEVTLARAKRDQAQVNLDRTLIRSPLDGVVARRTVQVGQQLQAGASILSVVPVANVHVDANFKEGQLARVKIGQPVAVTSDRYGTSITYHGVVSGLAGGTGSTFAAIPAQNATGNWIKVVQRVPVRIELDQAELTAHPLQVGLSMNATIDTRKVKG